MPRRRVTVTPRPKRAAAASQSSPSRKRSAFSVASDAASPATATSSAANGSAGHGPARNASAVSRATAARACARQQARQTRLAPGCMPPRPARTCPGGLCAQRAAARALSCCGGGGIGLRHYARLCRARAVYKRKLYGLLSAAAHAPDRTAADVVGAARAGVARVGSVAHVAPSDARRRVRRAHSGACCGTCCVRGGETRSSAGGLAGARRRRRCGVRRGAQPAQPAAACRRAARAAAQRCQSARGQHWRLLTSSRQAVPTSWARREAVPILRPAPRGVAALMALLRAAALLTALLLAAQPSALGQSSTTVTLTGGAPAAPLSPTSAATMGVNLGAFAL